MNASRLLFVLEDIEAEFANGFVDRLNKLTQAYTAARDSPTQDLSTGIRQARSELLEYLAESPLNSYTPSRRQVLVAIGAESFVADGAAKHIDELLETVGLSPASVVAALQTYTSELNQFRKACAQARQGLTALKVKPDRLAQNEAEVGILVPRTITKGKLDLVIRQFTDWNRILRGFAELEGEDEREIALRMLATGSDQVFVVTTLAVAVIVAKVIDKVLDWYKKILEIQAHRLELARLGAPVPETDAVKEHEKHLLDESIVGLVKELMSAAPKPIAKARKGELENQLTISIRQIARFVDQGGDVEVSVPPPPEQEFVTPTDNKGEPLATAELETKKAEWDALQQQRIQEWRKLSKKGAALAAIPARSHPVLQLGEVEEIPVTHEETPKPKEK